MQKFTHLHVHSHYSLLDGLPKIDELLDYTQELGMDSIALTDHGALYGAVEFFKKAKEKNIKPILGCEMYVAQEGMLQKRPNVDDKRYHLILLVKNEEGYKNLTKLITRANLEGFYYKPRIDMELLQKFSSGLICLSGCLRGKIPRLILSKKFSEAENLAFQFQEIFGKDNFYLELQNHPNLPEQKILNEGLISLSQKTKIPLVATHDVHYLKPGDAKAQDILMLINTGADRDDPERLTLITDDFSLKSPGEMANAFKNIPEAIENTQKIAESCDFQFQFGKTRLPYFSLPPETTADEYLKKLCLEGIKKRKAEGKKAVLERLEYELAVIKKAGFAPYFLIVQDVVNFARENRIVTGPGRGSVAGSLVAYLIGITNIDPLKYNLLFERFLAEGRISFPDIDLDFTDLRRDEILEYVAQKYGREKVAQIITFGTMAARAVIRDVGRALGYSYGFCDQAAKMIPMHFTLAESIEKITEFRQLYEQDERAKTLIDFSKKLEGVARHVSTHACGVVISSENLDHIVPLQHPTQDDNAIVTQYEMRSIEDLGLLKMDFLGLKNLTIIEKTLENVRKNQNKEIDIDTIPFNDKKTFQLLQDAKTTSVFQLESGGMKRYLKELKPTQFEDIVALIALYRPGPMDLIPEYIKRKYNQKRVEYLHPQLQPILKETYGLAVYQEQLMEIVQKLAGFTLTEADILRKAIGKKIKPLLIAQKEKLISGMGKQGIKKEIALKIWDWILPFARYGFNKSHSCSYATIAYQTAYLKAHFPLEFMAAVLASEKADIERVGFLIDECLRMGIKVLPPDINESEENFTISGENLIRFGLLAIKNVGHNVVESVAKERKERGPFKSIFDFVSRIEPRNLNKKSLESFIKAGCFDNFEERNKLLSNLEKLLEWNRDNQKMKIQGQKTLFGGGENFHPNSNFALTETKPVAKTEKLHWEKELLGLYVTSHPLEDFKTIFAKKVWPIAQIPQDVSQRIIKIGGIISNIKKIITRTGRPMLFLRLEDLTDKIEVVAFPGIVERNPTIFQENKIVLISGRVDNKRGAPKIICEDIEEIITTS